MKKSRQNYMGWGVDGRYLNLIW